jgi:hypothetical protein
VYHSGPEAFVFQLFRDIGNNVQEFTRECCSIRAWNLGLSH